MNLLELKKKNIRVGLGFAVLSIIGAIIIAIFNIYFQFTPQSLLTYFMMSFAGLCAYSLAIHLIVIDVV